MMRLAAAVLPLVVGAALLRQDPATEPPVRMKLLVDGQEYAVVDGVESEIAIGDKRSKVKVVLDPQRHFKAAGIEFDFPRAMTFEYDAEEPVSWTLNGNDVVIHVHHHVGTKAEPVMRGTLSGMLSTLDAEAKAPVRHEWTIGGKKVRGQRGRATYGDSTFEVSAVGLDVGSNAVVLMVQDTLGDDGAQRAECKRVIEMIERTLKITEK